MGALFAALGTFISSLIAKLVPLLSKKAMVVAFLASYAALVVAFILTLNGLLASAVSSAPSGSLLRAGLELMPTNTGACIAIAGSAYAARWVFIWKLTVIRALMQG